MSVLPKLGLRCAANKALHIRKSIVAFLRITVRLQQIGGRCASSQANPDLRFARPSCPEPIVGVPLAFTSFCPRLYLIFAVHRDNSLSTFHSASAFHRLDRQPIIDPQKDASQNCRRRLRRRTSQEHTHNSSEQDAQARRLALRPVAAGR